MCVCGGGGGEGEGDGKCDSLISNCMLGWGGVRGRGIHCIEKSRNLANKYSHFGQFLILSSVV